MTKFVLNYLQNIINVNIIAFNIKAKTRKVLKTIKMISREF